MTTMQRYNEFNYAFNEDAESTLVPIKKEQTLDAIDRTELLADEVRDSINQGE